MVDRVSFVELCHYVRRALPRGANAIGVGFGFKEINGTVTRLPAFRVYVARKQPLASLARDARIPAAILNLPTDVLEAPRAARTSGLTAGGHGAPLTIGAAISNLKQVLAHQDAVTSDADVGSLSFVAAENADATRRTLVAISNRHVLLARGARAGDRLYRLPADADRSEAATSDEHSPRHVMRRQELEPIAVISDEGLEGNHSYAYAGEPAAAYFIDCAAARILPERTRDVRPRYPAPDRERKITALGRLHALDALAGRELRVDVVAASSGVLRGRIVDVAAPVLVDGSPLRHNNIVVRTNDPAAATREFIKDGDSGALLVDDRGRALGMLWGRSRSNPSQAFACHIHPAVDRLNVTLVTYVVGSLRPGAFAAAQASRRERGARP